MKYSLWHTWLGMPHESKDFYIQDLADEYEELQEATARIDRWSEYADVVYTISRSRWDKHSIASPLTRIQYLYGSVYMFPKYTLRWLFFRRAGKKASSTIKITEVTNPLKVAKLVRVAEKYNIDPEQYTKICQKQLKYWPLLK